MAISVELQQFLGFAVMPGELSIGEAASIEGQVVTGAGEVLGASLKRFTVEATLKGLRGQDADRLIFDAADGRISILRGEPEIIEDFEIGAFKLASPVLVKAVPASEITIDRNRLVDISVVIEDTVYQ